MSLVRYYTRRGLKKVGLPKVTYISTRTGLPVPLPEDIIYVDQNSVINVTVYTVSGFVKESWCWQNPLQCFSRMIFHIHPVNPKTNSFVNDKVRYINWR